MFFCLNSKYQIGVAPVINSLSKRSITVVDPDFFGDCNDENYIAGEVDITAQDFEVGNGETYMDGQYCNKELTTGQLYQIYVGFASRLSQNVRIVVQLIHRTVIIKLVKDLIFRS